MSDLESAIRQRVQAAYDAWVAPPSADGASGSSPVRRPAPVRPVRFVTWEELDDYAEAALDIESQVRRELTRTAHLRSVRKRSRLASRRHR